MIIDCVGVCIPQNNSLKTLSYVIRKRCRYVDEVISQIKASHSMKYNTCTCIIQTVSTSDKSQSFILQIWEGFKKLFPLRSSKIKFQNVIFSRTCFQVRPWCARWEISVLYFLYILYISSIYKYQIIS